MKVKLKDKKMDGKYGLFRPHMRALNRGEVVEVDEIPLAAKPYLTEVKIPPKENNNKKGDK